MIVLLYGIQLGFHCCGKAKLKVVLLKFPTLLLEVPRAEDQDWHCNHFCCFHCDVDLGGKQYRPQEGQPYCLKCYEIAFASVCEVRSATTIQLAFHCYGRGSTTNSPLPPPDMWQTRESRPASTTP